MTIAFEKDLNFNYKILDLIIYGVSIIDLEGKIQYVNNSFLRIFKYENESDVLNRFVHEIFANEEIQTHSDFQLAIGKEKNETEKLIAYRNDNALFPVHVSCSPLTDDAGKYIGNLISIIDISELNKLKDDLKEKNEELDKLLKQKDDFIWQLGHDLKTPLVPLVTLIPMIEKKISDLEIKEILQTSIENINILNNRVDKILDLAKVSAFGTDFRFENLPLNGIVRKAIIKNKTTLQEKNISIFNEIDEHIIVRADEQKLVEVFEHLISNSIKYSSDNNKITIYAEEGDLINVSFEDTSTGMTKDQLEHIFDEFYKADESRHDLTSSGLGLSICKKIIEKHGGTINAFSLGDGKGITYYLTLKKG